MPRTNPQRQVKALNCKNKKKKKLVGGAEGIRTPDPHNAIVVLYQLSYDPNQSYECKVPSAFVKTFPRIELNDSLKRE